MLYGLQFYETYEFIAHIYTHAHKILNTNLVAHRMSRWFDFLSLSLIINFDYKQNKQ